MYIKFKEMIITVKRIALQWKLILYKALAKLQDEKCTHFAIILVTMARNFFVIWSKTTTSGDEEWQRNVGLVVSRFLCRRRCRIVRVIWLLRQALRGSPQIQMQSSRELLAVWNSSNCWWNTLPECSYNSQQSQHEQKPTLQ